MAGVTLSSVTRRFGPMRMPHGADLAAGDGEFCMVVGLVIGFILVQCVHGAGINGAEMSPGATAGRAAQSSKCPAAAKPPPCQRTAGSSAHGGGPLASSAARKPSASSCGRHPR